MINYLKLLNFELQRSFKILGVLIIVIVVMQMSGTVWKANQYMQQLHQQTVQNGLTQEQALANLGKMSFMKVASSNWFTGPIFIGVAAVLFYIFFIWYRDWLGKNTFIYRLLMLPTERINVYLAKWSVILMATLGFVSTQLIALLLELKFMEWRIPDDLRIDYTFQQVLKFSPMTKILFPRTFTEFLIYYGIGIILVAVIFTAIVIERSYRMKGLVIAACYTVLSVILLISPMWLNDAVWNQYFYPDEVIGQTLLSAGIVLLLAVGLSGYLLKKKIRV